MLVLLEKLINYKEGNKKYAYYEAYHLNTILNEQKLKVDLITRSAVYTHHIAVVIVDIDRADYRWYSSTNDNGIMHTFKTWDQCLQFVSGMRAVWYNKIIKC